MAPKKKEPTLEETFEELDQILMQLSDREISLEDSFALYDKGSKLLKYCNEKLDKVEKKMLILNEEGELDEF